MLLISHISMVAMGYKNRFPSLLINVADVDRNPETPDYLNSKPGGRKRHKPKKKEQTKNESNMSDSEIHINTVSMRKEILFQRLFVPSLSTSFVQFLSCSLQSWDAWSVSLRVSATRVKGWAFLLESCSEKPLVDPSKCRPIYARLIRLH